jgi:hypothetical protein
MGRYIAERKQVKIFLSSLFDGCKFQSYNAFEFLDAGTACGSDDDCASKKCRTNDKDHGKVCDFTQPPNGLMFLDSIYQNDASSLKAATWKTLVYAVFNVVIVNN